jgi:hypothetical protein
MWMGYWWKGRVSEGDPYCGWWGAADPCEGGVGQRRPFPTEGAAATAHVAAVVVTKLQRYGKKA